MMNAIDKALAILHATNDGNRLSPADLDLVQTAVNGWLNEPGEVAFDALYQNATKEGGYTVPWFLGIENMTRDHEGYVRWRGVRVEHYSHDRYQQGDWRAKMLADAQEIARRCRALEARGESPTWSNTTGREWDAA